MTFIAPWSLMYQSKFPRPRQAHIRYRFPGALIPCGLRLGQRNTSGRTCQPGRTHGAGKRRPCVLREGGAAALLRFPGCREEAKKERRLLDALLWLNYCTTGYTLHWVFFLPRRSKRTTPSTRANRVSSPPMPQLVPG